MYGYEILKIFAQKGWRTNTGTLYPALKQLQKLGLIDSFQSAPARGYKNRSNYKLTKKGFEYVQTTFNINIGRPELYILPFMDVRDKYLNDIFQKRLLILDFLNFINPQSVFKVLFPRRLPSKMEFKKVYDFNLENPKAQVYDNILLFLPFSFTYRDFYSNPAQNHLQILKDVKLTLKPEGRILIIDIEWIEHGLVNILSFMATGEVKEMAYTEKKIQELLIEAGYENIQVLKKQMGVILFLADNSN